MKFYAAVILFCVVTVIFFLFKITHYIYKFQKHMSRHAVRSHKSLTISLLAQSTIPFLLIVVPFGLIIVLLMFAVDVKRKLLLKYIVVICRVWDKLVFFSLINSLDPKSFIT
jgi:hypothetical protein